MRIYFFRPQYKRIKKKIISPHLGKDDLRQTSILIRSASRSVNYSGHAVMT